MEAVWRELNFLTNFLDCSCNGLQPFDPGLLKGIDQHCAVRGRPALLQRRLHPGHHLGYVHSSPSTHGAIEVIHFSIAVAPPRSFPQPPRSHPDLHPHVRAPTNAYTSPSLANGTTAANTGVVAGLCYASCSAETMMDGSLGYFSSRNSFISTTGL